MSSSLSRPRIIVGCIGPEQKAPCSVCAGVCNRVRGGWAASLPRSRFIPQNILKQFHEIYKFQIRETSCTSKHRYRTKKKLYWTVLACPTPLSERQLTRLTDPLSKTAPIPCEVEIDPHVSVETCMTPFFTATQIVVRTEDNYAGSMGFQHPRRQRLLLDGTFHCSDVLSISSWADIIG